jgi:hypothetical protein
MYREWLVLPMTRWLLANLRMLSAPQQPPLAYMQNPAVGAQLHAQQCGSQWAITRLENVLVEPEGKEELESNYGADGILQQEGF